MNQLKQLKNCEEYKLQKVKTYTVDLTKITGNGEISCPKCRVNLSPNDETEETYTISETETKANALIRITLRCNKCKSQIRLVGFTLLEKNNSACTT